MTVFRSFRSKLQTAFLCLGLAAIALTGWQASSGAATALNQANYDRLTALRETKRRQVEDLFRNVANHVLALSTDESIIAALEDLRQAWRQLPDPPDGGKTLREYYMGQVAPRVSHDIPANDLLERWFPTEPRVQALQHYLLAVNPHPYGAKDRLLRPGGLGAYSSVHARYHPTLHRYQSAFAFYDIFLIDADDGRILYSVFKEIDVGARLTLPPYSETGLGRMYRRAMQVNEAEISVMSDYEPYVPSSLAPAAFVAAPIWRAGSKAGVLAIQVSDEEVNRVLTGSRQWQAEGMGRTGQVYLTGPDAKLRSDLREEIERPEDFFAHLLQSGADQELVDRIRRNRTAILSLPAPLEVAELQRYRAQGTETGRSFRNTRVLRSFAPVAAGELSWFLVAEIDEDEVQQPVRDLRLRILTIGGLVALLFLAASWSLSRSVTRPVKALARGAKELGEGRLNVTVPVESEDELGELARAFNRMAQDLKRTTVSRDLLDAANHELRQKQAALQDLAGRLITAQEEERRRVGRELHDDITQRVAALAIAAGRLKNSPGLQESGRQESETLKQQLVRLSTDIHGLSRRLHPSTLEDLGLLAATEAECRAFFERGGAPVDFAAEGPVDSLPAHVQLAFYRMVQEALRNIDRHSGADEVRIRLGWRESEVTLEVHDNGRGFDRSSPGWCPGVGLASMEERARLLGGEFQIQSNPGSGTTIRVALPWEEAPHAKTHHPAG